MPHTSSFFSRLTASPARASRWSLLLIAAVAGALGALGQAPWGWWWLAIAGYALGIGLMMRPARPRAAALTGLVFGTGHFAVALSWIVEPFLVDAPRYGWMAPFALVLLAAGLALFWAAAAAGAARLAAPSTPRRIWGLVVALALVELARGYVLSGFPWATPGHVLISTPPGQLAAVTGPVGLTLLVLVLAALPVAWRARGAAAAAALLAAAWVWGATRLAVPIPPPAGGGGVVRLVQPNATQALKWRSDMQRVFFDRLMAATAADPVPDLVVWPETAVPWLLDPTDGLLSAIAAAGRGATVALGIQRAEDGRYYNSLAVVGPDAGLRAVYDKVHLVPFGEYTPMGDALATVGIRAFAARYGAGYSAGTERKLLDMGPLGKALPLICYEAVFPQDLRGTGGRADWIVQVTNDGWFGAWTGPYQHLAQSRLRAIETGLPLLRAANTGITAVIDARGRVLDSIALNTDGYIDTRLPGALPITLYARFGDWPMLLLLIVLGCLTMAWRRPLTPPQGGRNRG